MNWKIKWLEIKYMITNKKMRNLQIKNQNQNIKNEKNMEKFLNRILNIEQLAKKLTPNVLDLNDIEINTDLKLRYNNDGFAEDN